MERRSRAGRFELFVEALELRSGEVLAVLGPNGAGKSTLLRALAGLERPLAGCVERGGAPGPVTMVFQRPIALAGSVLHNLCAGLRGRGLSRAEVRGRAAEALERFGIAALARRRAVTLSGGELRRLALARAFALRHGVLLLDEPFDDLDPAGQESLSLDLRRAIAETVVAVAVVSHDLRRALLLCDRIAVLQGGRIAQLGPREEVLARPASPRVAHLVGMGNLVRGALGGLGSAEPRPGAAREPGAGVRYVEVDASHRIPVAQGPAASLAAAAPGTPVLVGIRPEHLKVDVGRGEGLPIGKALVRTLVSDGVTATLTLSWAGLELRTHLLAGRGLARTLAPGDAVLLSVRPEDVHLLPSDPR